jgi:hypothetical protein
VILPECSQPAESAPGRGRSSAGGAAKQYTHVPTSNTINVQAATLPSSTYGSVSSNDVIPLGPRPAIPHAPLHGTAGTA